MERYLGQGFFVAKQFTGMEGSYVEMEETIASFDAIAKGRVRQHPRAGVPQRRRHGRRAGQGQDPVVRSVAHGGRLSPDSGWGGRRCRVALELAAGPGWGGTGAGRAQPDAGIPAMTVAMSGTRHACESVAEEHRITTSWSTTLTSDHESGRWTGEGTHCQRCASGETQSTGPV